MGFRRDAAADRHPQRGTKSIVRNRRAGLSAGMLQHGAGRVVHLLHVLVEVRAGRSAHLLRLCQLIDRVFAPPLHGGSHTLSARQPGRSRLI
jgi:hypothetical protein